MSTLIDKNLYSLTDKDLSLLSGKDMQDILNIIHVANNSLKLPVLRAKIVKILKSIFNAEGVVFFRSDNERQAIDNDNVVSVGFKRRCIDQYNRYYRRYDPFLHDASARKLVCKVDDIMPYKRWVNLRVYNEFYKPQNMHYKLSLCLRSDTGILGLIGICRSGDYEDFSNVEMAKARIMAPFLSTALENINLFSENREIPDLPKEISSETSLFGVIILDYELRPIYWNAEAKNILNNGFHLEIGMEDIEKGSLQIPPAIMQDCSQIKEIVYHQKNPVSLHRQRIVDNGQGQNLQVVSSIIEHSFRGASYISFLIYLRDISGSAVARRESVKEQYQLTNKEAEIAGYISQGLTNLEISEKLHISRNTVETHLKNIFYKTSVRHRTALAGLLSFN